jgi:hypothetical protein
MIHSHGQDQETACGVGRSTGPDTAACSLHERSEHGEQSEQLTVLTSLLSI